MHIAYAQ